MSELIAAPRPIDLRAASDADYLALFNFEQSIRAERLPDDAPLQLEERLRFWKSMPEFVDVPTWIIEDADSAVLARGWIQLAHLEANQHLAMIEIAVLPAFRRHGLARRLLKQLAGCAAEQQRQLLMFTTYEHIPATAAMARQLGARPGLATHTNQLDLQELDPQLLERWLLAGLANSARFELGFWDGPFPEADLAAIARLYTVMNQAPRDDLQIEQYEINPQELRAIERSIFARGGERWVVYLRERSSDAFAGFSSLVWMPHQPALLHQGDTGVFPHYRGLGLGRWLKAAMLERVLAERPAVRYVRTSNADSNTAILKINHELGFKPYLAQTIWQIERTLVEAYLARRA